MDGNLNIYSNGVDEGKGVIGIRDVRMWGLLHFPPVPLRWKEGEGGALGRDYRCN